MSQAIASASDWSGNFRKWSKENAGMIIALREARTGKGMVLSETSVDATTRFWRGRELLVITDLTDEETWPKDGKKDLNEQAVFLGITWKPTPRWRIQTLSYLRCLDG